MSDIFEEFESLLFDWEAGTLGAEEIDRLREILKTNEKAREFYINHKMISAAIKLDADAGLGSLTNSTESDKTPTDGSATNHANLALKAMGSNSSTTKVFRVRYWAIAAALLIGVLAGRLLQLEFSGKERDDAGSLAKSDPNANSDLRDEAQEATSEGVALVTRLVDVAWDETQTPYEVGDALPQGRLGIKSGFAQIEFFCGATVVVEGPAELDLRSTLLARVRSGKLRAQVPPAARGFSLEVDDMKVVDLGTEFGLSVNSAGTNVQVFEGEVELRQPESENRLLVAGNALVRDGDGKYSQTEITPGKFLDIRTLESRAVDQRDKKYRRWKEWSDKFRLDNRLIAYYAFDSEGDWLRRLDSSREPKNDLLDGAIVGARQVSGRWVSKRGLEFKRPGDRVRVQIPGEFTSLSFTCWVKIDSLDRWYNSLFLTDGYEKGEPHWQILENGQIYFSVRPLDPREKGGRDFKALSPSFWKPTMSGKWLHLAVTCDLEANQIVHYLNGRELSRHQVPAHQLPEKTRIGTASIGNWSIPTRPDAEFAIRNLNGSIDEFTILAAVLSADEIKEIYEHGKP